MRVRSEKCRVLLGGRAQMLEWSDRGGETQRLLTGHRASKHSMSVPHRCSCRLEPEALKPELFWPQRLGSRNHL